VYSSSLIDKVLDRKKVTILSCLLLSYLAAVFQGCPFEGVTVAYSLIIDFNI
jgi:hypothetical protein